MFVYSDEQNYMLRDAEAEVLFGFSLEESLKRAHTAPLFKVSDPMHFWNLSPISICLVSGHPCVDIWRYLIVLLSHQIVIRVHLSDWMH